MLDSINTAVGGTTFYVAELTEQLAVHGVEVDLYTINYKYLGRQRIPNAVNVHAFHGTPYSKRFGGIQLDLQRSLKKAALNGVDLIHNHGLWLFCNLYARQAAHEGQIPLIISPHGMLETWSMKRRRAMKKAAWNLWELKNLRSATIFHATSEEEARSIRELGLEQPIAVIPNGIQPPSLENIPKREVLEKIYPELRDKKWLLFMSRIHPKKGVEELLVAWKHLLVKFPLWHLVIAGPEDNEYAAELARYVKINAMADRVTFTGMLEGDLKECALGRSDLFVLPTHSENFGRVIAESLAYGVPVVTTKEAPWQDLISHQCGWWIQDDLQALKETLFEAMFISCQDRRNMGLRGRALVVEKCSSDACVLRMIGVYEWAVHHGKVPDCVIT